VAAGTGGWLDSHRAAYGGMRVCVTGGAGFIGSHLVEALDALGAHVTVIDDLCNGFRENLAARSERVRLIEGSILDADAMARAAEGAAVIFHLAALGSVPRSVEEPMRYHRVNVDGTLAVLETARATGARVSYSASSSAYGDTPTLPKIESMRNDPRSPYAVTKLAGEEYGRAYALCYGVPFVSLRYFNIFGPRQREDSQYAAVIPRWAAAIRAGRKPLVYGNGSQTRDFTHVHNAVHANLLAGRATSTLEGQTVNIGCGAKFSLLELLAQMNSVLGTSAEPDFQPARAGDVKDSLAAIDAAKQLIGYEPVMDFAAGLRGTLLA
jgi:UDP-glucose 4-epimerase